MTTNISKQRRDALIAEIEKIKDFIVRAAQDENARSLLSYLADLTREVNGKKYGLVFEEHREAIDETLEANVPVLCEEKGLFVQNGGEMNFLLEGDNLASLALLEKTHKGKIDVIYIDPPYNTGKNRERDFSYDDHFVDANDTFRHSKWLSFMKKRLEIAKRLLSEKGAIFISIDDNEQTNLKLLCDEIFGEGNFVGCISRATGTTTGQDANKIGSSLDYCLVFRKSDAFTLNGLPLSKKDEKRFKDIDEKGKYSILQLRKTGSGDKKEDRPNMFYDVSAPDGTKVYPFGPTNYLSRWRVEKKTYEKLVSENMIVWKKDEKINEIEIDGYKKNKWIPYVKYYFEKRTKQVSNLFIDIDGNKKGSIELKEIFNQQGIFDNPKPIQFIEILLRISLPQSTSFSSELSTDHCQLATVLDFFAGSGTTGHAVLKLNAEDGGRRKFILCTNNENDICRGVTYRRLKTVITGKRADGSAYSDGLPGSLKYFKVDFVPISEKLYYEYADSLLLHIKELVELENALDFDSDRSAAIALTDGELEAFCKKIVGSSPTMTSCKTLYLGHDVLPSAKQKRTLKARGIAVNVVPEYYYADLNA